MAQLWPAFVWLGVGAERRRTRGLLTFCFSCLKASQNGLLCTRGLQVLLPRLRPSEAHSLAGREKGQRRVGRRPTIRLIYVFCQTAPGILSSLLGNSLQKSIDKLGMFREVQQKRSGSLVNDVCCRFRNHNPCIGHIQTEQSKADTFVRTVRLCHLKISSLEWGQLLQEHYTRSLHSPLSYPISSSLY